MTLEVGIHLMGGRETKLPPSLTPSLLDVIRPLEVLIGNNSGAVTSLRSKVNANYFICSIRVCSHANRVGGVATLHRDAPIAGQV